MNKNSQVRFRPDSLLPAALGLPDDAVGAVICKYLISNPSIGSHERIDVKFDGERVAWGVPAAEFEMINAGAIAEARINQSA